MSKFHTLIKASCIAAVLISCGCESDAIHEPKPEECSNACTLDSKRCTSEGVEVCQKQENGCTDWKLNAKCESGTHCDKASFECIDNEQPVECEETCEANTRRCAPDGVEICKMINDKCFGWITETLCEGDTHCNSETFECAEEDDPEPPKECPEPCEENVRQCGEEGVEVCKKQENGCLEWSTEKTCEEGTHCDSEKVDCIEGCVEICEEGKSKRCSDHNELEECKPNANGCAEWSVIKDCGELSCNSEKADCINDCTPACTKDAKQCNGNGVATCIDPKNDGCTVWDAPAACKENQSCESGKCVDKCTSDCSKEGATESTWTSLRTCKKTADGCLKWENTLTCKKGEMISGGKCVKVCGSNCNTFSVVLLPDTQYYTRKVDKDGNKKTVDGYPNPNIFADQLLWISDKRKEKNIKAVIHLGDITDTNDKSAWKLANKAYIKYLDNKDNKDLPYIVAPGNHDFKQCKDNDASVSSCTYARKSNFGKTDGGNFNADRFKGRKWFGEYYKTTNSYITFNAGGIDFLVIALEFGPRKEAVTWANNLIKEKEAERKKAGKPGYKVIIETHAYIQPSACRKAARDGNGYYKDGYSSVDSAAFDNNALNGKQLYDQLTSRHNNIILVVNGHHSGSFFRLNKGKAGNVFGELVVDYQSENGYKKPYKTQSECQSSHYNGGAGMGFLRILHFNPDNVTITANTHSTLGKAKFKNETKIAFCSKDSKGNYNNKKDKDGKQKDYYPENYSAKPGFNIDATHPATEYHAFTVTGLDFVTPVEYKFDNKVP